MSIAQSTSRGEYSCVQCTSHGTWENSRSIVGGQVWYKTGTVDGNYLRTTTSHLAPASNIQRLLGWGPKCVEIAHHLLNFDRIGHAKFCRLQATLFSASVEPKDDVLQLLVRFDLTTLDISFQTEIQIQPSKILRIAHSEAGPCLHMGFRFANGLPVHAPLLCSEWSAALLFFFFFFPPLCAVLSCCLLTLSDSLATTLPM